MTENPPIEKFAADTILQRGVKVLIPAPFFLRLVGKKTVSVKLSSPFEGTMHRVASYYLSTGITEDILEGITVEAALALHAKHGKAISKAVACAILNGYVSGYLFTKPLAWYLRWNLTPIGLFNITTVLLIYGGISDFINTTKSVRKMTLTMPKMGQKVKGS